MLKMFRSTTLLNRHQFPKLLGINKANFSMVCNGNIPIVAMHSHLQNQQQSRSFWLSPIKQNYSDNSSTNKLMENDHPIASQFATEQQQKKEEEIITENGKAEEEAIEAKPEGSKVPIVLTIKNFRYAQSTKWLTIKYGAGRSGKKFLDICKADTQTKLRFFPKIHVPEDVFAFMRAMDEVLNAVDGNKEKIEAYQSDQKLVLYTAKAKGIIYDFELELCQNRFVYVNMRTVPNENKPEHKSRHISVPIQIFHWLRQAIEEVFVENGEAEVQQQLAKSPSLPDWLNKIDVPLHTRGY